MLWTGGSGGYRAGTVNYMQVFHVCTVKHFSPCSFQASTELPLRRRSETSVGWQISVDQEIEKNDPTFFHKRGKVS